MESTSASRAHELRPQLLERRARLQDAAGRVSAEYLNDLLAEVDAALDRMDQGTYGLCEVCHESIEVERLRADPMLRFCLDHLDEREMRAHQQDLDLATRIQWKLLPASNVALRDWTSFYHYEPAGAVGGDYCEVTALDGDALFFAVGDVAGKGVAASLLMTHLSAILRSLLSLKLPLAEMLARANRLFCESTLSSHYATLVCGRASGGSVEMCNAGHCPPMLLRGANIERLDNSGVPLGLFCSAQYPTARVELSPGETLVLYSDGVTEAQNPEGLLFEETGLMNTLRCCGGRAPEALAHTVIEDVSRFRAGARPNDDLTLLVLRRQGMPAES